VILGAGGLGRRQPPAKKKQQLPTAPAEHSDRHHASSGTAPRRRGRGPAGGAPPDHRRGRPAGGRRHARRRGGGAAAAGAGDRAAGAHRGTAGQAALPAVALAETRWARGCSPLLSRERLDEDTWEEIEEILITADVGVTPTSELVERLRTRVRVLGTRTPDELRARSCARS